MNFILDSSWNLCPSIPSGLYLMLSFKMKIQRWITAISLRTYFAFLFSIRSSIFHSTTRVTIHYDWWRDSFSPLGNIISCTSICLICVVILFDFHSILECLIRLLHYPLRASNCIRRRYTLMLGPNMKVKRWCAWVVLTASTVRLWFFKWHWIWLGQLFNLGFNGIVVDPWALGKLFEF